MSIKVNPLLDLIQSAQKQIVFDDEEHDNRNEARRNLHSICYEVIERFQKMQRGQQPKAKDTDWDELAQKIHKLHERIETYQISKISKITEVVPSILLPVIQSNFEVICSAKDTLKWTQPETHPSHDLLRRCCLDLLNQIEGIRILCPDKTTKNIEDMQSKLALILEEFTHLRLPTFLEKTFTLCRLAFFSKKLCLNKLVMGSIFSSILFGKFYLAASLLGTSGFLIHNFFDYRTASHTKEWADSYFAENSDDSYFRSCFKSGLRNCTHWLADKMIFVPISRVYHQFMQKLHFSQDASPFLRLKTYGGFAELCKTSEGQNLLNYYLDLSPPKKIKKLVIDHATRKGSSLTPSDSSGMLLVSEKPTITIVKDKKGKELWEESPIDCTLGHELLHYMHFLEEPENALKFNARREDKSPWRFNNAEEMFTITGQAKGEKPYAYSENQIRTAAGKKLRTGHFPSDFPIGSPVDAKLKDGSTPLHEAVYCGALDIIKDLLRKGAKINAIDGIGRTPLYRAFQYKQYHIAEFLIQKGGILNNIKEQTKSLIKDKFDQALHDLIKKSKKALVEYILSSPYCKDLINQKNNDEDSPLHIAANLGSADICELLLSKGAKIDAINKKGETALDYALKNKRYKAAVLLIEKGANLKKTKEFGNILHEATMIGNKGLIRAILTSPYGKDLLNRYNCDGLTPLHLAIQEGQHQIAEILLQNKANVNLRDKEGATPVHYAVFLDSSELLPLLCTQADLDLTTNAGMTPLHVAILKKHQNCLEILTGQKKVQINALDKKGKTPLDYAVEKENAPAQAILLEHGAKKANDLKKVNPFKLASALIPRRTFTPTPRRLEAGYMVAPAG